MADDTEQQGARTVTPEDVARAFLDTYHEEPIFDRLEDWGPESMPRTRSLRGAAAVLALLQERAQQEAPLRKAPQNGPIGLEVPCPTCAALPGERCILVDASLNGWRTQPHYSRSADAQGKNLTA